MALDIYSTATLIKLIRQINPVSRFFTTRYFETGKNDIFETEQVLMQTKKDNKMMAPFVIPKKKGISVERDGYQTSLYTPPYIAPERSLYLDDLEKNGFGEVLFKNKNKEEKALEIIAEDLIDMRKMIHTRIEWMCAQVLFTGQVEMRHYADKYGSSEYESKDLRFFNEKEGFQNIYTPSKLWSNPNADFLLDLYNMVTMLSSKGLRAEDVILSQDVVGYLMSNEKFLKLLDTRSIHIGAIAPKQISEGVTLLGTLNVYGTVLNLFVYNETYYDNDLDEKTGQPKGNMSYVPSGTICVTYKKMGNLLYGAVNQLESDEKFHLRVGKEVPKITSDIKTDVRTAKLTSKPLVVPKDVNGWVISKVLEE